MNEKWKLTPRVLVCAAIRKDGLIIAGPRHFDKTMRSTMIAIEGFDGRMKWKTAEQGFIDQMGDFYTREEAFKLAKENGQFKRRGDAAEGILFSEDLY